METDSSGTLAAGIVPYVQLDFATHGRYQVMVDEGARDEPSYSALTVLAFDPDHLVDSLALAEGLAEVLNEARRNGYDLRRVRYGYLGRTEPPTMEHLLTATLARGIPGHVIRRSEPERWEAALRDDDLRVIMEARRRAGLDADDLPETPTGHARRVLGVTLTEGDSADPLLDEIDAFNRTAPDLDLDPDSRHGTPLQ